MKKDETRKLILDTASDLFYKNGYNLTGINQIIAEAGIAKATLYAHFRSKEALCIAYLRQLDEQLIQDLTEFCQAKPTGKKRLMAILEFLIPFFESDRFNGCWCMRTIAEIPKNDVNIRAEIKKQKKALLKYIENLVTDNTQLSDKMAIQNLARRIYLLYESSVAESHLHNESWPIHENINLLNELLRESVAN